MASSVASPLELKFPRSRLKFTSEGDEADAASATCVWSQSGAHNCGFLQSLSCLRQPRPEFTWKGAPRLVWGNEFVARYIADPELWTERYHCSTWPDYLRQRNARPRPSAPCINVFISAPIRARPAYAGAAISVSELERAYAWPMSAPMVGPSAPHGHSRVSHSKGRWLAAAISTTEPMIEGISSLAMALIKPHNHSSACKCRCGGDQTECLCRRRIPR
jgi:hypothetical protein